MPGTLMMGDCGSATDLCAALRIIEEDGPACGLHLNRAKLSAPLLFPTPFQLISLSHKEDSTSWVPPLVTPLIVRTQFSAELEKWRRS